MTPDLTGEQLASVACETTLDLRTDGGWYLTIENDYALERPGFPRLDTAAGQEDEIVSVLASLVGRDVRAIVSGSGGLALAIGDATVRVDPSPDYESWSMVGPRQERVVSTPGGELATWGPAE